MVVYYKPKSQKGTDLASNPPHPNLTERLCSRTGPSHGSNFPCQCMSNMEIISAHIICLKKKIYVHDPNFTGIWLLHLGSLSESIKIRNIHRQYTCQPIAFYCRLVAWKILCIIEITVYSCVNWVQNSQCWVRNISVNGELQRSTHLQLCLVFIPKCNDCNRSAKLH